MRQQLTIEEKAVRRGARYLDKKVPNWFRKVKVSMLRMQYGDVCILGQCFGDYFAALKKLHPRRTDLYGDKNDVWGARHGFYALNGHDVRSGQYPGVNDAVVENNDGTWERLGLAWAPEIRARRKAAKIKADA